MEYSFPFFSLICVVGLGLWEWSVGHLGKCPGLAGRFRCLDILFILRLIHTDPAIGGEKEE